MKTYRISGKVIDRTSGARVPGLRVEAWDKDLTFDDFVGKAETDDAGSFLIEFSESYFLECFIDRHPDLFFKVFQGDKLIKSTEESVLWNISVGETEVLIEVDVPRVATPEAFIVRGQVRLADGNPFVAGVVRAYDKDLRTKELLGEQPTDAKGNYQIRYSADKFKSSEKASADLVVEVYRETTAPEDLLVLSGIVFNAPAVATIDLRVPLEKIRVPSELELYGTRITPLLEDQRVIFADLNAEDVAFISGETGIPEEHIDFLVIAAKLERETRVRHKVFYACCRTGLPSRLEQLLDTSESERAHAIDLAVSENIITPLSSEERKVALDRLDALAEQQRINRVLRPAAGDASIPLGKLLDIAGLSAADQHTLGLAWLEAGGAASSRLWHLLKDRDDKLPAAFETARKTLGLSEFLDDHVPLVHALANSRDLKVSSIEDLASLEASHWKELSKVTFEGRPAGFPPGVEGDTDDEKAQGVVRMIEAALPVQRTTHSLRANGIPGLADGKLNDKVKKLVSEKPLDIRYADIGEYVNQHPSLNNAGDSHKEALIHELKKVQRVFRLAPRESEWRAMLEAGASSAEDILTMGKDSFAGKVGANVGDPNLLFDRAESIIAANLLLAANFTLNNADWSGAPAISDPADVAGTIPNLENLFGPQDHCECKPCQAVTSPAAYFTDLLAFLKNPELNGGRRTAYEALCGTDGLRPDLSKLELSCANSDVLIPAIDLVNEILENAVSNAARPGRLAASFAPQTGGTSEERGLNPEHTDSAAYERLKATVYPWSLPFDLWLSLLRRYLSKLELSRAKLIELFREPYSGGASSSKALACEYLNLTAEDFEAIVARPTPAGAWKYWFAAPPTSTNWQSAIGAPLSGFLRRSKLSYQGLLDLLDTRFVNEDKRLQIEPAESCNLEQLALNGLDNDRLQRIHSFERLRRRIGWTTRELDLMSHVLTKGSPFSEASLLEMAEAVRLYGELNLPSTLLATLWGEKLDTYRYTEKDGSGDGSLYDQLFQNPLLLPSDTIQKLQLTASGDELLHPVPRESILSLGGVLSISPADLSALFDRHATTGTVADLTEFSRIVREVLLARGLGISVADLLQFISFGSADPLTAPSVTRQFVATVKRLSSSGFSLIDLKTVFAASSTLLQDPAILDNAAVLEKAILKARDQIEQDEKQAAELADSGAGPPDPIALAERKQRLLAQALSQTTSVALEMVEAVWTWTRKWDGVNDKELGKAIAEIDNDTLTASSSPLLATVCSVFSKLRILIVNLDLSAADLRQPQFFGHEVRPLFESLSSADQLRFVGNLIDLTRLRKRVKSGTEASILDLFQETANEANAKDILCDLELDVREETGGATFVDLLGITVGVTPSASMLTRLRDCVDVYQSTGVSGRDLAAWAGDRVGPDQCAMASGALKALSGEGWEQVKRDLQDESRSDQRNALVSFLLGAEDSLLQDTNHLFDRFLIDVETTPCKTTTRMAQAIASVQLFIEECLSNLLPADLIGGDVVFKEEAARWWQWMKNYRVWEANRKVFLFPENWLNPDLRDDKTPYFKDLESELMQGAIKPDTKAGEQPDRRAQPSALVEQSFRGYLQKLNEVARLQVCGMYLEERNNDLESRPELPVLHVIARSPDEPRRYYYRKQNRGVSGSPWTPWEKIEAEIEGDHLIPVVFKGRLFVFWPVFDEESVPPSPEFGVQERAIAEALKGALSDINGLFTTWFSQIKTTIENLPSELAHLFEPPKLPADGAPKVSVETGHATVSGDGHSVDVGPDGATITDGEHSINVGWHGVTLNANNPFLPNSPFLPGALPALSSFLPSKRWIVKLSWVEHRNTSWSGKNISSCSLSFRDASAFFLKGMKRRFSFSGNADATRLEVKCFLGSDSKAEQYGSFELRSDLGSLTARTDIDDIPLLTPAEFLAQMASALPTAPVTPGTLSGAPVVSDRSPTESLDVVLPHQFFMESPAPFFFLQDSRRVFFVDAEYKTRKVTLFYHPYVPELLRLLDWNGLSAMMELSSQERSEPVEGYAIAAGYEIDHLPNEVVDFELGGPYSQYNWEIFVHAPWLIASQLSTQRRFREAQAWLHYIFNPTSPGGDGPDRYWKTKPLHALSNQQKQKELIEALLAGIGEEGDHTGRQELEATVEDWRNDPFEPYAIARSRPTAFQKAVVLRYVKNLIAWGDDQFRQKEAESLNEAARLYILAAKILGRRPEEIQQSRSNSAARSVTFATLDSLDAFSNSFIELENLLVLPGAWDALATEAASDKRRKSRKIEASYRRNRSRVAESGRKNNEKVTQVLLSRSLAAATGKFRDNKTGKRVQLFCTPASYDIESSWIDISDRLFKLRNCLDIEGERLDIPPFAPPINPELLIHARALGVNVSDVLADVALPLPHYRFNVLSQKASELCAEVKTLGAALLSALEKRDAEDLMRLRQTHEINLLNAVTEVRQLKVQEAHRSLEGLELSKRQAALRLAYYVKQFAEFINPFETSSLNLQLGALTMTGLQAAGFLASATGSLIPNFKAGFLTTIGAQYGGPNVGDAAKGVAGAWSSVASMLGSVASMVGTVGGYVRRAEDWLLQIAVLGMEQRQLEKQIAAARLRLEIAEHELENHMRQLEHAKDVDDYLRSKFTGVELYSWMVEQLSGTYYQSYQLTYDVAKRAERAFRHELGLVDSNFIEFGYWESLKQGLLSGERLHHDIKRMEVAYLDQNKRELELTRHVSLRQLDPLALLTLKTTGACQVTIPEWLYDRDCPGHYMRRIKSVALSMPSVVGPYTSVNCTLSLVKSSLRTSPLTDADYDRGTDDDRFVDYIGGVQSIVTSSGSNDSGLFETNLRDERFLPFEGAGADSTWTLELPQLYRAFDYATISDVIFHIRYTARPGVAPGKVNTALQKLFGKVSESNLALLFSLRQDFPTEWSAFVNSTSGPFTATIRKDYFPYFTQGKEIKITGFELYRPDGTNPLKQHALGDQLVWHDSTTALGDNNAFTVTAEEDVSAGATQVLTRAASATVFLIVRYSLLL